MGQVDGHEKHPRELGEQPAKVNQHMARAKAHTRPWRAIIALVLAIVAAIAATQADGLFWHWTGPGHYTAKLIAALSVAAFCVFAVAAVLALAGKATEVLAPAVGSSHAAMVRYAILLTGGITAVVLTVALLKVPIGQLLVGGAVTTILLGIAGQQALANVFAGLMLLMSRPFSIGQHVQLKSGALGGVTEGQITEVGITYVRLDTGEGILNVPNSQVLAAAVGPIPPPQAATADQRPGPAPASAAATPGDQAGQAGQPGQAGQAAPGGTSPGLA
jgi:small-conductance mechanosensitive channel